MAVSFTMVQQYFTLILDKLPIPLHFRRSPGFPILNSFIPIQRNKKRIRIGIKLCDNLPRFWDPFDHKSH